MHRSMLSKRHMWYGWVKYAQALFLVYSSMTENGVNTCRERGQFCYISANVCPSSCMKALIWTVSCLIKVSMGLKTYHTGQWYIGRHFACGADGLDFTVDVIYAGHIKIVHEYSPRRYKMTWMRPFLWTISTLQAGGRIESWWNVYLEV